ncbi:thioredoxin domain-containing protein, partial [Thermodesulfovibrio sp. N1]|uniref:thioredoxin domain-containing protein n=1 Tax=Thermodesulfovibrio sp. N1 TaxID=1871110 RepID=UPI00083AC1BF
ERGYKELKSQFDREFGGFGIAPKFPLPLNLMYIHRYYYRSKENDALNMNLYTMKKMRFGGIYDQIGFGFHRYSTDRMWIVPHFEKMLYDNALLMITYTEAYQITKNEFYKDVANEIADFLLRDMYYEKGVFYSAIDADSEGQEGKFYIWSYEEIEKELKEDEILIAEKLFSLSEEGNFYDEIQRKKTGKNILYIHKDLEEYAEEFKINLDFLKTHLRNIREKLLKIRQKRVKPFRDEKILTDWNSLACIAFVKSALAFERNDYLQTAEKCMDFISNHMFDNKDRLLHVYKDGESLVYAYLEDHAYLIWALIELYLATFKSIYLSKAIEINNNTIQHFWDYENNGFYHTPQYSELILTRVKESYDGVLPSGNAVMAYNLIRLARITGNIEYENIAKQTLKAFSDEISKMPSNYAFSLIALDLILKGTFELVVIPENRAEAFNFLIELNNDFIPNLLILVRDSETEKIFPNIKNMNLINEKTTYYLCKNFECQPPTNDAQAIKKAIIS